MKSAVGWIEKDYAHDVLAVSVKQIMQHVRSGKTMVQEVPAPQCTAGSVLVRVAASLVSAGTERMVVDFAHKNLVQKARARPDLVAQTVEKARREGVLPTLEAVQHRLDRPMPLGYSCAGIVLEVGEGITDLTVGDHVACAGTAAAHAEVVVVSRNLVVPLAPSVELDAAAFVTLGAIALQGIRLAEVSLGEVVAVIGLGLLGQLTVQMLRSAGCVVLGMDPREDRVELARRSGASAATTTRADLEAAVHRHSHGSGVDAVLITADTPSNDPVELAGAIARDRAIVVAVGAVGTTLPRKPYYEKELDFRISRSYGPGRYDPSYEEAGHDYPIGYVRWTENRNMQAFAHLLAENSLDVRSLISHRFPIEHGPRAYDLISGSMAEPFLGVLLTYEQEPSLERKIVLPRISDATATSDALAVGMLGAGNFATNTLLPAMRGIAGLDLVGVVAASGLSAHHAAQSAGFRYAATNERALLDDPRVNLIAVVTRHDLHARQAIAALHAGKDVFVEKPLALDRAALLDVLRVQRETDRRLTVGFNRRFAPMVHELHGFLAGQVTPLSCLVRINAGALPPDHWTRDPKTGGGRIIGEACHFIDLLQYLVGAPPVQVTAAAVQSPTGLVEDEVTMLCRFANGSVGTVLYSAGGDRSFSKEYLEVVGGGKIAVLDDYRALDMVYNGKRHKRRERFRPDKGHRGEWEALARAAQQGQPFPISLKEIVATHLASYAAVESVHSGAPVSVDLDAFWRDLVSE